MRVSEGLKDFTGSIAFLQSKTDKLIDKEEKHSNYMLFVWWKGGFCKLILNEVIITDIIWTVIIQIQITYGKHVILN